MDERSKWEVAFRSFADKEPSFWKARQRRAVLLAAGSMAAVLGLFAWELAKTGHADVAGALGPGFLLASWVAWYRFYGILAGAAEAKRRTEAP